jgi:predicted RNA binding protein YcfA (HicA-like mRNA interferase family)
MPQLPRTSVGESIRALVLAGFEHVCQTGNHGVMEKTTTAGTISCTVSVHLELKVNDKLSITKCSAPKRIKTVVFLEQLSVSMISALQS